MLAHKYYDRDQNIAHTRVAHRSENPWAGLAVAIIKQAALDYERLGKAPCKRMDNMPVFKSEIRSFLRSRWFAMLTVWCDPIDPEQAIKALDRRAANAADT